MSTTLTQLDLRLSLAKAGLNPVGIHCSAASYAVPTLDYLRDDFYSFYWEQLGDLRTWQSKWECWQFTTYYLGELQRANALTVDSPTGTTALAVGRWDFKPDAVRGLSAQAYHSIVAAITDQGPIFLDPQNNNLWTPSDTELASTVLCLF